MNKEFIFDCENLENVGKNIKDFFIKGGNYVVIRNFNQLSYQQIKNNYEKLLSNVGEMIKIDLKKDTYEESNKYWADVKFDFGSDEKQFWRSSNHQNMHTDNTFCKKENYANLTALVCLKPVEYSGNTTLISNNKLIELIKFSDKYHNTNYFDRMINKEILHSGGDKNLKRKMLEYFPEKDQYVFCYNYFPASRGNNGEEETKIIKDFQEFLEEKIMNSSLMDEVKLNYGDSLIFNDELVLHGRRSFLGTRHYIKTGIFLKEAFLLEDSLKNYNLF